MLTILLNTRRNPLSYINHLTTYIPLLLLPDVGWTVPAVVSGTEEVEVGTET